MNVVEKKLDPEFYDNEVGQMLDNIIVDVFTINDANGWDVLDCGDFIEHPQLVATKLALLHSEVSEAMEALRNQDIENFHEEMIDIFIRWCDLANIIAQQVNLGELLRKKLTKNARRGYRHGGKVL